MREKEKATRVIYVRHGETDFPINRIYCDGKEDPPLNGNGRGQAESAADHLSALSVDAIYASPCTRTDMTAKIVAKRHGLGVQFDDELVERNFGVWEGMYFEEIESEYPALYREWKENQAAFKPENGESVYDMAERVSRAVKSIVDRHDGRTVIVVSHVGPIRVQVAQALSMPVEAYRRVSIDPASVTRVDYGRSQNNLILLNFHARHWV